MSLWELIKLAIEEYRREQALEIVRLLRYGRLADDLAGQKIAELERLIPNPQWVDLIFNQVPDLSDEAVVEAALTYRPFAL